MRKLIQLSERFEEADFKLLSHDGKVNSTFRSYAFKCLTGNGQLNTTRGAGYKYNLLEKRCLICRVGCSKYSFLWIMQWKSRNDMLGHLVQDRGVTLSAGGYFKQLSIQYLSNISCSCREFGWSIMYEADEAREFKIKRLLIQE